MDFKEVLWMERDVVQGGGGGGQALSCNLSMAGEFDFMAPSSMEKGGCCCGFVGERGGEVE